MDTTRADGKRSLPLSLVRWFDSEAGGDSAEAPSRRDVDWVRILPLILLHLGCLGVVWVGWSPAAVGAAAILYLVRMFAVTGFYHRYFSHRTFRAGRLTQFLFAVLGNTAVQRGPLWWASHHRIHHRFADRENDPHSPVLHGFWWSHIGWILSRSHFPTRHSRVKDWSSYPELRWLNRFDKAVPLLLAAALYVFGWILERRAPGMGTDGPQMLVWGFFVSTTVLLHATLTINSLDHLWGRRRYETPDTSRNNPILALITLGEGWHNNHHRYAVSARQGFFWWEVDITYYVLVLLEKLGIVHELRGVPDRVRAGPAREA